MSRWLSAMGQPVSSAAMGPGPAVLVADVGDLVYVSARDDDVAGAELVSVDRGHRLVPFLVRVVGGTR